MNKVIFEEADEEFVGILFNFLTLPLGTIAKLLAKHEDPMDVKVGNFTFLYQSIVYLDVKHFTNVYCKEVLVNPVNSSAYVCQKLKLNLDTCVNGSHSGVTLLKEKSSFIITDDLKITPFLPADKSFQYLSTLGVECINSLHQTTIDLGFEEFTNLLKWSLLTNNALTKFLNGGSKPYPCPSSITNTRFGNSAMPKTVTIRGNFLKEQAKFIVSDDLQVALSSPVTTISKFSIGVLVSDIEVREASIGEREALSLLKASLTSTSVLTNDCLISQQKPS
ncbi:hypothetical protein Tco_1060983 [Tanacetum coccineum]